MINDSWLLDLLTHASPRVRRVVERAEQHRLQILVGSVPGGCRVDSDWPMSCIEPHGGSARRELAGFRVDAEYFYPASTVKLAISVCALLVLQELQKITPELNARTPFAVHPLLPGHVYEDRDESNLDGQRLCIEHEIRKIMLVSDNPAHNRLYSLVGHKRAHQMLHAMGLRSIILNHRLAESHTREAQRRTNRVEFILPDGRRVDVPARDSQLILTNPPVPGLSVGERHCVLGDEHAGPMDFSWRNRAGLADLQALLAMVTRPDHVDLPGSTGLTEEHRTLICRAMWPVPRQSDNPHYGAREFPDLFVKHTLPGLRRLAGDEDFVIFNKIGQAFGFTIENAYICHRPTGRAFYLTANIYANASGVLGTDTYDYASVSIPFMAELAETVARELWA